MDSYFALRLDNFILTVWRCCIVWGSDCGVQLNQPVSVAPT